MTFWKVDRKFDTPPTQPHMRPGIILALAAMLLVTGCRKEDTSPVEEQPSGEEPVNEPITLATIGEAGGTLRTGDIIVSVPAGAFSEPLELRLSALDDSCSLEGHVFSKRYLIEGLPESYDQPIKVRISYQGTLSGEYFVVTGEEAICLENGQPETAYSFLDAVDSSGYLICSLPGADLEQKSAGTKKATQEYSKKNWVSVQVFGEYFFHYYTIEDLYYKIYMPADMEDLYSPEIADWLDNAYERISIAMFPLLGTPFTRTYSVFLANLSDDVYCRFAWRNGSADGKRKPKGILAINIHKIEESDKMQIMVGRELLRAFLFNFDPEYPFLRPLENIPHHWLDQAVITYSETEFAHELDRADHIPSDFPGNELKPFHGIQAGSLLGSGSALENLLDHGRGLSTFIQYLVWQYSHSILSGTYIKVSEGLAPLDAVKSPIYMMREEDPDYSFESEYLDFLAFYMEEGLFQVDDRTFYESIPQEHVFLIDDQDDTLKVFHDNYPDLSARLYRIDLNDPEFREKGILEFSPGGSVPGNRIGLRVYGYKEGKLTPLGGGTDHYEASIFGDHENLMFMVFNATANSPYTGNSTIDMKVRAKRDTDLPYNYCQLELSVLGNILVGRVPEGSTPPYTTSYNVFNTWKTVGECRDRMYKGTLDPAYHPAGTSGTLVVTFDDSLNIESYQLVTSDQSHQEDTLTWVIDGASLPKSYQSGSYLQHEAVGTSACGAIKDLFYYSESAHADGGVVRYILTGYSCTEQSLVKFGFRKD